MERAELLRGIYDAFRQGDIETWLAAIPEDFEWHWPPGMIEGAAVFRGAEGVREGSRTWAEAWDQAAMEPTELLERGDEILVVVRYRARGRTSGLEFDDLIAHLWRFRDDQPVEMRILPAAERAKRRFLAQES